MSKNLARKGFAFGALVALAATAFTGVPASADSNGPVTLTPAAGGTTFNSILQSGINLASSIDPSQVNTADVVTTSADTTDQSKDLTFLITNSDARKITAKFDVSLDAVDTNTHIVRSLDTADSATEAAGSSASASEVTHKLFAIKGGTGNVAANSVTAGQGLKITTSETDVTVTLTVQPFIDRDGDLLLDAFEKRGKAETVILYPVSAVTATTTVTNINFSNANRFKGTVVFNNNINPFAVAGKVGARLFKNGTIVEMAGNTTTDVSPTVASATTVAANGTTTFELTKNILTFGVVQGGSTSAAALTAGTYTAQAVYATGAALDTAADIVSVGAPSSAFDATVGSNVDVTGVRASFLDSANAKFISGDAADATDPDLIVRAATKEFTLGAQIVSGDAVLDASDVQVKAIVSAVALDASSIVSISGSTGTLVKDGASITALARTDANGKVSFAVTSTTGKSGDAIDVELYVKNSSGVWVAQATHVSGVDVAWQVARFDTFTVKGGNYVSGANPTVTVQIKDQFGQGLDAIAENKLSASAVAVIGGLTDSTKYNGTAVFSGGKASFTFANFAAVNGVAQLKVSYYKNGTDASQGTLYVNVYNAPATKEISVASLFKTNITYKDFVTGDKGDAAVAKKISDAGIAGTIDITGTVLNVNNVGQNGLPVTVSFPGALLIDGDTYAADKIETKTNEYGYFTVSVAVHTVNTKGATVTISADGKTATTLVKSYLPSDLGAANLAFSWSLPAFIVKDTTYAATLKLTDKWGNSVKTTSKTQQGVTVSATGALQVNGVSTDVERNFDKNGQVTIYLRSVSKIAGPAEVTATLNTDAAYAVSADATDSLDALDAITTDVTTTVWDETKFSEELSAEVVVRDLAPKATVAAASKAASVVVKNASGLTVTVVSGTKSVTKVATSDSFKVSLTKLTAGKKTVKVYVNDVLVSSKSVTVKK